MKSKYLRRATADLQLCNNRLNISLLRESKGPPEIWTKIMLSLNLGLIDYTSLQFMHCITRNYETVKHQLGQTIVVPHVQNKLYVWGKVHELKRTLQPAMTNRTTMGQTGRSSRATMCAVELTTTRRLDQQAYTNLVSDVQILTNLGNLTFLCHIHQTTDCFVFNIYWFDGIGCNK